MESKDYTDQEENVWSVEYAEEWQNILISIRR